MSSDGRVQELADRLLYEVVRACPVLLHIRQVVWDADQYLDPRERNARIDETVSPRQAYWKGQRASGLDLLANVIGEVVTNDTAVLPWDLRFAVIARIIDRLTSHD